MVQDIINKEYNGVTKQGIDKIKKKFDWKFWT